MSKLFPAGDSYTENQFNSERDGTENLIAFKNRTWKKRIPIDNNFHPDKLFIKLNLLSHFDFY